jgi:hypothetical protein
LSGQCRADAGQARTEPVNGGCSQRLSIKRQTEEQPEPNNERNRYAINGDALAGEAQWTGAESRIHHGRAALALRAEE